MQAAAKASSPLSERRSQRAFVFGIAAPAAVGCGDNSRSSPTDSSLTPDPAVVTDGVATVAVRGHLEPIGLLRAAVNTAHVAAVLETRYSLMPDAREVKIESRIVVDGSDEQTIQHGEG